jgi:hypothetical protein
MGFGGNRQLPLAESRNIFFANSMFGDAFHLTAASRE